MKLSTLAVAVATAWIILLPSMSLAQSLPPRCNWFPNLPICRILSAPEIDAAHGLAAIAAVLAGLALVRERRIRAE